jgi:hypothetical protein
MNRIILTAIAAATISTAAYAGDMAASSDTLTTRSEPATVTVVERDRGISGSDMIAANAGVASVVDADNILTPRESAIAEDGQVTVYSFATTTDNSAVTFSPR